MLDEYGKLEAVRFRAVRQRARLPGAAGPDRLVAAGTSPNITYEKEYPERLPLDERKQFFQPHSRGRAKRRRTGSCDACAADGRTGVLHRVLQRRKAHHLLRRQPSRLRRQRRQGDGLSEGRIPADRRALRGRRLSPLEPSRTSSARRSGSLAGARLDDRSRRSVVEVRRLTPTIVEVIVRAPAAARNFEPGQFFRLQNFEAYAPSSTARRS